MPTILGRNHENDAAPDEGHGKFALFAREAKVHRQGHCHARPYCRSVDRSDHRLQAGMDAQAHLAGVVAYRGMTVIHAAIWPNGRAERRLVRPVIEIEHRGSGGHVGACAEPSSCSGNDYRADSVVVVGPVERREQIAGHVGIECVQFLGTVEGDRKDTVFDLGQY